MTTWEIQRLARGHDRSAFACGRSVLDDWLRLRAAQFDRKDLARTFVAVRPGSRVVAGYYAVATHRVLFDVLPPTESKGLPRLDVPVVQIGRLAVDRAAQRQGLGASLLIDALRRAAGIAEQIGIRAVEVDALDAEAKQFCVRFGFRELLDDPQHLFLPMHEIRKLKLDPLP